MLGQFRGSDGAPGEPDNGCLTLKHWDTIFKRENAQGKQIHLPSLWSLAYDFV